MRLYRRTFPWMVAVLVPVTLALSVHAEEDPKPPRRGKKVTWAPKEQTHKPGNSSASRRHEQLTPVKVVVGENPPYLMEGSAFVKEGIKFGPNHAYEAIFNPAPWTHRNTVTGVKSQFVLLRAEKNNPDGKWKKKSELVLVEKREGEKDFRFVDRNEKPMFPADGDYEVTGGTEDGRYADMRLEPYVDPIDGKTFDGAIMYTGFDGENARIAVTFFNHDNPSDVRKAGLVFKDEDVLKNPLVPGRPWNKSMAFKQYRLKPKNGEKVGKVVNLYFFGEGNLHHGGIMAMTTDKPFSSQPDGSFGLKFPQDQKPVIVARKGKYTQGLVESAHQPIITKLTPAQARKTGHEYAVILDLHGDTSPYGYAVGWAAFPLENPESGPIYQSNDPYLFPTENLGDVQVEKVIFNSGAIVDGDEIVKFFGEGDTFIGTARAKFKKVGPGAPFTEFDPCRGLVSARR